MGEAMADVARVRHAGSAAETAQCADAADEEASVTERDYRYAHDEPDAYAAGERYLPDELPDRRYYRPVPRGLEIKIGEALARLRAREPKKG